MPTDGAQAEYSGSGDPASEPLACVTCRSRKLKCDRVKPACGRCSKIKAECVFPESRRKPPFKRRNVKELEERLAQVEGLLKDGAKPTASGMMNGDFDGPINFGLGDYTVDPLHVMAIEAGLAPNEPMPPRMPMGMPEISPQERMANHLASNSGELIELGLFEALPPMDVMEELNGIYFQRQHPSIPIIHPGRYTQAFYSAPHKRPPMCLQYAVWTMASNGHEKYATYHDVFYKRARQYADADEMKGYGEHFLSVAHAQAWALLATDEARTMHFTRAAMSGARCIRLANMMGLHRLDGPGHEMAPTLGPPTCWTDLEERRRIFWGAYCIDSHASISTGWPTLIHADDISTHLPSSEEAFNQEVAEETSTLEDAFKGSSYSTFAGSVVICYLFNQILKHVHRAKPDDRPQDFEYGEFWTRHRDLDNTLSSAFMFLPERFRMPKNLRDPTAVHTNLNLHASVICVHQAAIEKVDNHKLPESLRVVCVNRLRTAAEEICNIVKLTSHVSAGYKSPLVALSMYCAVSVYTSIAKDNPQSGLTSSDMSNLEFIFRAMEAISRDHLITQAFLQQVYHDIKYNGLESVIKLPNLSKYRVTLGPTCSNTPLLARSSISRHTEIQPPLPGRLPLSNPQGRVRRDTRGLNIACVVVQASGEADAFGSKRKRTSTPEPSAQNPARFMSDRPLDPTEKPKGACDYPQNWTAGKSFGSGMLRATGVMPTPDTPQVNLPHRSGSSSTSSPYTQSGSNTTTPAMGLGTMTEEDGINDANNFQTQQGVSDWDPSSTSMYGRYADPLADIDFDATSPTVDPWVLMAGGSTWQSGDNGTE